MMKGVLDFLTDPDNKEAEILRQHFVFKIIPMMNPDGVINGNYRCSLAGCDLNRRWKTPSKVLQPIIYQVKKMINDIHEERECVLFCDLHGHSRRKNVFMYGCNFPKAPEETRLFPYMLSKICPYFYFNYSKFGVQKSKDSTARVALFKDLKIPNIFTMESSFCGNDQGPHAGKHFTRSALECVGADLCRTLLLYCGLSVPENMNLNPVSQEEGVEEEKKNESPTLPRKKFKEDTFSVKQLLLKELIGN